MGKKIFPVVYGLFLVATVVAAILFGLGKIGRGTSLAQVAFAAAAALVVIYLLSLSKK